MYPNWNDKRNIAFILMLGASVANKKGGLGNARISIKAVM